MTPTHYTLRRAEPDTDDGGSSADRDALVAAVADNPKLRELVVEERRGRSWGLLLSVDVLDAGECAKLGIEAAPATALVDDVWRALEEQAAMEGPTRFRVTLWERPRGKRPLHERTFVIGTHTLGEVQRESEAAVASMLASQAAIVEKLSRMLERSYSGREAACLAREASTSKLGTLVEQVLDAAGKATQGLFAGASGEVALKKLEADVKAEDNRHAEAQRESDSNDEMLMELLRMFGATMLAGDGKTAPAPPTADTPRTKCREARDLARVLANASAKHDELRELLGDDGWALISEAARAPDLQTFDALFGRFHDLHHGRGREDVAALGAALAQILGLDMMVLMRLAQGYEERHVHRR